MRLISALALLIFSSSLNSQLEGRQRIDSLKNKLAVTKEDTQRVELLLDIADNYSVIAPDSGIFFLEKAEEIIKKTPWLKGEIKILTTHSHIAVKIGDFDKALNLCFKALDLVKDRKEDKFLSSIYSNLGLIYLNLGDNSKALKYHLDDIRIAEKIGQKETLPSSYNSIGIVYMQMGEFKKAIPYYEKAMKLAKESKDLRIYAYAASNTGTIYQELGEFRKALRYHFEALVIEKKLEDIYGMATEYASIGDAYRKIYAAESTSSKRAQYLDSSIYFLSISSEYCLKCNDLTDLVLVKKLLSEVYKYKKDYKRAYIELEESNTWKDSVFSIEKTNKIRETEEKQLTKLNDIKLAKERQIRNIFIGGFILMLAFASIFFYQRKRIQKEKKRSEELLHNILPEEVAEELKQKGFADAKAVESVTILFTDFKGFTMVSEKLSPHDLVSEIDTYFRAFDHITEKFHIEKIKTIGDAYMCAGGLPIPSMTHPEDVVYAALEMRDWVHNHALEKSKTGKPYFEVRIGVHTGQVVAGIVGVKKFAYDIWGDAVNLASRMESSGEVGKVNISQTTYELLKDKFSFTYRGKLPAKNKGDIDMYFVERIEA